MKAIIIKELRENLKWAVLMLLALAAALAYAIHTDMMWGFSLVGAVMQIVSAVGFPVLGLALGLLQILQDQRTGRWGFLTHRPISRTNIFFAKMLAGAVLYLLAGGLPLAAAVAWTSRPGNVAGPFDWHMVLPRLADLFGGLMWYTAGLLMASREARWIGSRLLPMGLALLAAGLAWVIPLNFTQAVLILSGGIVLFLPAACASFVAGGNFERQPAITRILQFLSVETGIVLSAAVVAAILIGGIDFAFPPAGQPFQSYRIDSRGEILQDNSVPGRDMKETDLQGHPVGGVAGRNGKTSLDVLAYLPLPGYPTDESRWDQLRDDRGLQGANGYVRFLGYSNSVRWYYVVRRRTIEGFNIDSNLFAGSIGPNGFTTTPEPFPDPLYVQPGSNLQVAGSRSMVYQVDLDRREIHLKFKATLQDPILGVGTYYKNNQSSDPNTVVATRSGVRILHDGQEIGKLPLEHSYPPYRTLEVGQTTDGRFILHYTNTYRAPSPQPDWVVESDSHGQVIRRTELPPFPTTTDDLSEAIHMLACPPVLIAIAGITGGAVARVDYLVGGIMAVGSILVTMLLVRRYALNGLTSVLWMAIAATGGISGVLVLPSLRQLPPKVKCHACGRKRSVTRETCEHCGAAFNEPALEGIEILEIEA